MHNTLRKPNFGYGFAIASAVLFGASTPATKYLLGTIDSWLLAGILYLGSGLGLGLVLTIGHFIPKKIPQVTPFTQIDYIWLALATLFGGVIAPVLLMFGLAVMTAASVSLLLNFETVLTALIAWLLLKEYTNGRLILGMVLIVAGGVILAWSEQSKIESILGAAMVITACLAWAVDNNITRKISTANPLKIVAIKSLVAGSTNVGLAFLLGAQLFNSWAPVLIGTIIGFVGYGLSILCFILGLRHIGTGRTSAAFALAPFIGVIFSIFFLGDTLSSPLILAGVLMFLGLLLHLTEHHAHEHRHESLLHQHQHVHDQHHQHPHQPEHAHGASHSHLHQHTPLLHSHPHYPDIHHRHNH
ncbi:MAG: DMT family transporter [Alphaproteobacteria bacterium]|nr:DMT family transporter [Alphaproteobacteria bacterium]